LEEPPCSEQKETKPEQLKATSVKEAEVKIEKGIVPETSPIKKQFEKVAAEKKVIDQ